MAGLEDEFGDVVRKAREGLGLSPEETARRSGVSPERLAALESYQASPTREESDALARSLGLGREALWRIAAGEYRPVAGPGAPGCEVVTFTFEPVGSHGYLIHVEESGDTLLVDPGGSPGAILALLGERGWRLTAVLITHGHSDHVAGLRSLLQEEPVPVYGHPAEYPAGCEPSPLVPVTGPAELAVGGVTVRALYTPGHTPHGLSFVVGGVAAVGDTLFAGSLGRAHRGPENYDRLLASARLILSLPDETLLLPGHGPLTTVGMEKRNNPYLAD